MNAFIFKSILLLEVKNCGHLTVFIFYFFNHLFSFCCNGEIKVEVKSINFFFTKIIWNLINKLYQTTILLF